MRRHNRLLFRVALSVVGDPWEAEEVVQETYLRALTRLHEFAGPSGLRSWLAKIALNEGRGRLRRRRSRAGIEAPPTGGGDPAGVADDAPTAAASPEPDPEHLAAAAELRRAIEAAIRALPAPFRTVFVLRAVERMSVAEVAECLAIPPATVKTRCHRANALLRRRLRVHAEALMPELFPFAGERCDRIVAAVLARLGLAAGPASAPGAAIRLEPPEGGAAPRAVPD